MGDPQSILKKGQKLMIKDHTAPTRHLMHQGKLPVTEMDYILMSEGNHGNSLIS